MFLIRHAARSLRKHTFIHNAYHAAHFKWMLRRCCFDFEIHHANIHKAFTFWLINLCFSCDSTYVDVEESQIVNQINWQMEGKILNLVKLSSHEFCINSSSLLISSRSVRIMYCYIDSMFIQLRHVAVANGEKIRSTSTFYLDINLRGFID